MYDTAARLVPEGLDRLLPLRSRRVSSPGACARCAARQIPARRLSAIWPPSLALEGLDDSGARGSKHELRDTRGARIANGPGHESAAGIEREALDRLLPFRALPSREPAAPKSRAKAGGISVNQRPSRCSGESSTVAPWPAAITRTGLVVIAALVSASALAATPDELLKLADRPKQEFREAVIHARITVTQNGKSESPAEFELYKKGEDRGLVVFTAGKQKGRKILTVGEKFWLIVPGSSHAIAVTPNQRLMGGASLADVSKLRFSEEFNAALADGPETVDGRPCDVLKLTPKTPRSSYGGGTLWVDRGEHLARKAVLGLVSGKPAKEITFDRYGKQDGKTVLSTMSIRDLLAGSAGGTTRIDYTDYRQAHIDDKLLTPEGALAF